VDDATLARLEHENMIAADLLVASLMDDATIRRDDGFVLLVTGLRLRLFNQAIVDGVPEPVALERAVAALRSCGAPWAVTLRAGVDDDRIPAVVALGLHRHDPAPWMPGMALHPLPAAGSVPVAAGLEIRRVDDQAGVDDHGAAAAESFGIPVEWLHSIITLELARHPDAAMYTGYVDGRPVVSGLGIRSGRTIGIYDIATIESARGRGYGAAMTMRIVDDGAAAGCDVASLQASDMGRPIYERLGFRTVVEYDAWVDP
jgi:hypothetical protein